MRYQSNVPCASRNCPFKNIWIIEISVPALESGADRVHCIKSKQKQKIIRNIKMKKTCWSLPEMRSLNNSLQTVLSHHLNFHSPAPSNFDKIPFQNWNFQFSSSTLLYSMVIGHRKGPISNNCRSYMKKIFLSVRKIKSRKWLFRFWNQLTLCLSMKIFVNPFLEKMKN